jgi:hypothetical protein
MKSFKSLLLGAALALVIAGCGTGCATSQKSDLTQHPVKQYVVVTPNGDVIAPTNASVTIATNVPRFSLRGFLWGYPSYSLVYHRDEPKDAYSGGGKFVLADPAFAALASTHTNQNCIGGQSSFTVGSATITVSTNGISAIGTAGSQLINSVGSAIGNAAGSAAKSAVTTP